MKKLLIVLVLLPMMTLAGKSPDGGPYTETVNGITWTYFVADGEAKAGDEGCREEEWGLSTWGKRAIPKETTGPITIPSQLGGCPVASIGDCAFWRCGGLTSVTIPSSVTSIGYQAFIGCSNLQSIVVAADNPKYQSIDGCLLSKDGTLLIMGPSKPSVTIPSGVLTLEYGAFRDCVWLTSVTIPSSVTSISLDAFCGCANLQSIVVAADNPKYQSIDGCLLSKDGTLLIRGPSKPSVTIPSGVLTLEYYGAFHDCVWLTSVTIPSSVTSISPDAFCGCANLQSIVVDPANGAYSSIDGVLYDKAGKELILCPEGKRGTYSIPLGVTSIGDYAFDSCGELTSVTIPSSVTSIGRELFGFCDKLTAINVASDNDVYCSIDGILYNKQRTAIIRCPPGKMIGSVTIPSSVTSIGIWAFGNCPKLKTVTLLGNLDRLEFSSPFGEALIGGIENFQDVFPYSMNFSELYVAPGQGWDEYVGTEYPISRWADDDLIDHGDIWVSIKYAPGSCAFLYEHNGDGDDAITITGVLGDAPSGALTIPATYDGCPVTSIGGWAFQDCSELTSVTIPSSVTSISPYAFSGCANLQSIVVDPANGAYSSIDGVLYDKAGKELIRCPEGLTSVTIPSSVTSVWYDAFYGCANLQSIVVDPANGAYSSIDGVLYDKAGKELILCPGGKRGTYSIPLGVTSIGDCAFDSCGELTSVTIPSSVTSIGRNCLVFATSSRRLTLQAIMMSTVQLMAFFITSSERR